MTHDPERFEEIKKETDIRKLRLLALGGYHVLGASKRDAEMLLAERDALRAEVRTAKADAWDEGHDAGRGAEAHYYALGRCCDDPDRHFRNPYRADPAEGE